MGQPVICPCGTVALWTGDILGPENSQQITDWYSFTHIIHGFLLYLLLRLFVPRLPLGARFAIAIGLEAGWEILENTPFVIERYRQSALAAGYVGDSIVNSLSDSCMAAIGFLLARSLPTWSVVVLALVIELVLGYRIHDNLTLNILQLVHPSQAISRWQASP
jgi:hypothetical protein